MGGRFDATNVVDAAGRAPSPRSTSTTRRSSAHTIARDRLREGRHHQARHAGRRRRDQAGGRRGDRAARPASARAAIVAAMEGVALAARLRPGARHASSSRRRPGATAPSRSALRGRHQVRERGRRGPAARGARRTRGARRPRCRRARADRRRGGRAGSIWSRPAAGRRVLFDAAHNPAGAAVLAEYLAEVHPGGLPMVFGVMRDKNAGAMLAALLPRRHARRDDRAAHAARGQRRLGRSCAWRPGRDGPSVIEACRRRPRRSSARSQPVPPCCVAGSIFLAGALLPEVDPARAIHGPRIA